MSSVFNQINYAYTRHIVASISQKYRLDEKSALLKFINSKTNEMFSNVNLLMWEFSPNVIFEIWECEQITGDPRNSEYLRGE